MTFSLTTHCLYCRKERDWNTHIMVFVPREDGHRGDAHVVTVCRDCRKLHTIEELIQDARAVY